MKIFSGLDNEDIKVTDTIVYVLKDGAWIPFFFLIDDVYYLYLSKPSVNGLKKILPVLSKTQTKFYLLSKMCFNNGQPTPFFIDHKLYTINTVVRDYFKHNIKILLNCNLYKVFEKNNLIFDDILFSYIYDFEYTDVAKEVLGSNRFRWYMEELTQTHYYYYGRPMQKEKYKTYQLTSSDLSSKFSRYVRKKNVEFLL